MTKVRVCENVVMAHPSMKPPTPEIASSLRSSQ
jgi:hypothetical protein